jgi:hypothetical protein
MELKTIPELRKAYAKHVQEKLLLDDLLEITSFEDYMFLYLEEKQIKVIK